LLSFCALPQAPHGMQGIEENIGQAERETRRGEGKRERREEGEEARREIRVVIRSSECLR
jgi:hypothetical protein